MNKHTYNGQGLHPIIWFLVHGLRNVRKLSNCLAVDNKRIGWSGAMSIMWNAAWLKLPGAGKKREP